MSRVSHVTCGACGAEKGHLAGFPRVSKKAKAITPEWETMRVVQCTQCGFYYTDPMPFWDETDLQTLYDDEYFIDESTWWHNKRTKIDSQKRLDSIILEQEIKNGTPKMLDIGCGQGYMLEHAQRLGWGVYGLEPSKVWAHKTSERLGVTVWDTNVEDADIPASKFDIVFSDSVIEHLADPMMIMKLAHRVLKPGGVAYFVTPNAQALVNHFRGLVFRLVGSRRSPFIEPLSNPYHIVGFSPRSLVVLSERAGFKVRRLWVRHGKAELFKTRGWSTAKYKSLVLWPVLLVGEFMGRGTTIDVLLIRR